MPLPIVVAVLINGIPIDFGKIKPTLYEGQVRVPGRAVIEKVGGIVTWNTNDWTISIERDDKKVTLRPVKDSFKDIQYARWKVGTQLVRYDWSFDPYNYQQNVTVLVPLRFLAEQFGLKLDWNAKDNSVSIE